MEEPQGEGPYPAFEFVMSKHGYTWEPMEVTTEDGYILTLFHVTGNADGEFTPTQPPVLIMHGGGDDGSSWIGNEYYVGKPMHLQLADAGYDVFIGNQRGTRYSLGHKTLTYDDPVYWAWSFSEFGKYE